MFVTDTESPHRRPVSSFATRRGSGSGFWLAKRSFDLAVSLAALPILATFALALLLLNPFFNRGPLFFTQPRMGLDGTAFAILKFRSMRSAPRIERGAADPLERHRITTLGSVIRRLRIDELPQIVNVLRGEMSLIGPRPDFIEHARCYAESVPGYRARHVVRPGITGYAQVEMGYVDEIDRVARKTELDLFYIENVGWRLETQIVARTLLVILSGFGAR